MKNYGTGFTGLDRNGERQILDALDAYINKLVEHGGVRYDQVIKNVRKGIKGSNREAQFAQLLKSAEEAYTLYLAELRRFRGYFGTIQQKYAQQDKIAGQELTSAASAIKNKAKS